MSLAATGWMVSGLFALAANGPGTAPPPDPDPADAAPSREMLLYLAEFAAADGNYLDPSSLEPGPEGDPLATRPEPSSPPAKPAHVEPPSNSNPR